jgi:hypothetical protein
VPTSTLPVRERLVNDDATPTDALLVYVRAGFLSVEPDGSIWRHKVWTKWGARDVKSRRIDTITTGGYRRVRVRDGDQSYCITAHRLVWTYFNGPVPDGLDINHKDSNRGNNRPDNLQPVTPSENAKHAHAAGSYANRRRKTPWKTEEEIRRLRRLGLSWRKIGAATGVSQWWCRTFVQRFGIGEPSAEGRMRFGYADPPYLGCGKLYAHLHNSASDYDRLETHAALIERLNNDYPDGWAMSASSVSLRQILPLCPEDVRVAAWVKPFAVFKPNVNPAYAWEPVIFRGGRKYTRDDPTQRDWVSEVITLKRGTPGAKPQAFCFWVFALLNARPGDVMDDLFPGSGAVSRAWEEWVRRDEFCAPAAAPTTGTLFDAE